MSPRERGREDGRLKQPPTGRGSWAATQTPTVSTPATDTRPAVANASTDLTSLEPGSSGCGRKSGGGGSGRWGAGGRRAAAWRLAAAAPPAAVCLQTSSEGAATPTCCSPALLATALTVRGPCKRRPAARRLLAGGRADWVAAATRWRLSIPPLPADRCCVAQGALQRLQQLEAQRQTRPRHGLLW